ncbi:MAG: HAD-IA family hydrolase [Desulfobacterales bacterium]
MARISKINIKTLLAKYSVLLLDAYGVLVHSSGALPGAARLINTLNRTKKPFYILTNDASKLPATSARLFQSFGLAIAPDKIITSGSLLVDYFAANHLEDAPCAVLGPEDSARYVELAGGKVVAARDPYEVLVIGDESGYSFLETVDTVLSGLFKKFDSGANVHLVLPNPDLIYPKADQGFGIASGSIALILEAALQRRYPARPELKFARLGKPHAAIFREALERSGTRDMVMIGDQLETDIRGAVEFGLDAVLVSTGIAKEKLNDVDKSLQPTYYLDSLSL